MGPGAVGHGLERTDSKPQFAIVTGSTKGPEYRNGFQVYPTLYSACRLSDSPLCSMFQLRLMTPSDMRALGLRKLCHAPCEIGTLNDDAVPHGTAVGVMITLTSEQPGSLAATLIVELSRLWALP